MVLGHEAALCHPPMARPGLGAARGTQGELPVFNHPGDPPNRHHGMHHPQLPHVPDTESQEILKDFQVLSSKGSSFGEYTEQSREPLGLLEPPGPVWHITSLTSIPTKPTGTACPGGKALTPLRFPPSFHK